MATVGSKSRVSALALPAGLCVSSELSAREEPAPVQIPVCEKKIGTLAVHEPENRWRVEYNLESLEALMKIFVNKSKVVRDLDPGMMLYPSGEKDGIWWKVSDELGNEGWVPSPLFNLAK